MRTDVKLKRLASRGLFPVAEHDTDLHANLVYKNDDCFDLSTIAVNLRSACDMSRFVCPCAVRPSRPLSHLSA